MRQVRALSILALLALFGGPSDARPGGGQSYRSSSSSSSSRSSGSSSSYRSSSSSSSSRSSSSYSSSSSSGDAAAVGGVIGVAFAIGVLFLIIWGISKLLNRSAPQRAAVAEDDQISREGLVALRKVDPKFDENAFAARVRDLVARVNAAWVEGKMDPARRFISDGVYVRFVTQLRLLKARGVRNAMADSKVRSAKVLGAEADPLWDTVHVKISAEARDKDVDANFSTDTAVAAARKAPLNSYQEVWSFVRRRGKTSEGAGRVFEGKCPSCGAELPASEVVRCQYCKALTNSGEHDWVLAEITQPEEWSPGGTPEVDGIDTLRARDPMVSVQALEDRASVVFWKWIDARVTGERKRLDRFCRAQGVPHAPRANLSQVAVGAAECTHCDSPNDGYDRVYVDITWSASTDGAEPENMTHTLTLARAESAKSVRGLSSLDCPNCGGALAESDAITCQYCGTALSGGKDEWALEAVD
jgi:predicted lipid-binding transport protein (Tim44 family)